jgi:hypothetical protein
MSSFGSSSGGVRPFFRRIQRAVSRTCGYLSNSGRHSGRRRPHAGAAFAIAGILAGAADLTPFLAVAAVAFTAGLSWIEPARHYRHA